MSDETMIASHSGTVERAGGVGGHGRAAAFRRHRALYRNLARREVRQRYKGSILGVAWTLITPLIMVGAYSLVFHYVWRVINIPHYALFLFVGLAAWTFFMGGLQLASASLVANSGLVTKVRFPRELIPLSSISANAVTAGAMFVIAIPLCLWLTPGSRLTLIALPAFVLFLGAFTIGLGLFASVLNVYFRDVEHIIAALALPWFFLTPIFYSFDTLPGQQITGTVLDVLYYGNPVTPFVSAIRETLFFGTWPGPGDWVYCSVIGVVALVGGSIAFRRMSREIAVEL